MAEAESDNLPSNDPKQLKRSHETENYKVCVQGLPHRVKFYQVQQMVADFGVKPHKIRLGDRKAYLAFKCVEDRDKAMAKLDQQEWKSRQLTAKAAEPKQDPFWKKQRGDAAADVEDQIIDDDTINSQVCPLWNQSYDEQLQYKEKFIKTLIDNLPLNLLKLCPDLKKDSLNYKTTFDGVEPSPVVTGYRNKCEFNVGHDSVVGFKLGRYKNGFDRVFEPSKECPILNKHMFTIRDAFQQFLNNKEATKLRGFNQVTHEGHVRQITIRTNQNNECMIIIDIHPQDLTKEELDHEIESLVNIYKEFENIISIYINTSERTNMIAKETLKLVHGQQHLSESLFTVDLPLRFSIGPTSFFQVNTKGAETLYKNVMSVAQLNNKSLVLDVGCGTGTIGLSLARFCNYVIGIDIVESAIRDAKANAEENKISNVAFFAGTAESLIGEAISILKSKLKEQNNEGEIVAIVDPPRQGFGNSFIKTIRGSQIKKLIYIACDPKNNSNLISLCRPTSKAYPGAPFIPIRAKAFDLFPHTRFVELLLVYERENS